LTDKTHSKKLKVTNPRLHPGAFHSRWYHLTTLRNALIEESKEAISKRGRGQTLVDLGCGSMPYKEIYEPLTAHYIGVDLPMNPSADLHISQSGQSPLADASVDIVLSSQVLEHVPFPQAYLKEANRMLKPGGLLFLSTHSYWMYHPDPTDFWRWTHEGLRKEIEQAGFRIEHIRGIMNLAASGLQLFQDGVSSRIPSPLRPLFFFLINRAMAIVDKLGGAEARNRDACVFVIRAIKE
jgi:SAM-dependent methyltransferase